MLLRKAGKPTLPVSEIFYSIEGEGLLTGYPTVFIRAFGCNFTCQGFSNHSSETPDIPVVEDIQQYADMRIIESLKQYKPLKGCDSAYSWHPDFKHLSRKYDPESLWNGIYEVLPEFAQRLVQGNATGIKSFPALSITGGEPLLHQKFWTVFFQHTISLKVIRKLIIETNASVPLHPSFMDTLKDLEASGCLIVWANSPKLTNSGEPHGKAIRPSIILQQQQLASPIQYFKFVSDGSEESFREIESTVNEYNEYLFTTGGEVLRDEKIYVMPEGALKEQQELVQRHVAAGCLKHGYSLCARVHCWVYNNEIGT